MRLETASLTGTDARLFSEPMIWQRAATLATDELLAERVDAFVARFARLQDTLGDKLLGEPLGASSTTSTGRSALGGCPRPPCG